MQTVGFRHVLAWVIALGVISLSAFDGTTNTTRSSDVELLLFFVWLVLIVIASSIVFLARTLRNWEQLGPAVSISRSLLSFTFLLGIAAGMLYFACQCGIHIEACRTVGELETCQGQASPQQVLGMLAWHAANVVPGLDITHSLEWPRPARSADALVGATILVIRLWVVIGILGLAKRLWDKWGPGGSSLMASHSARSADVARRAPGGPPKAEPGADAGPAAPQAPP